MTLATASGASTQRQKVGIWGTKMALIFEKISATETQLGRQAEADNTKNFGAFGIQLYLYGTEIRHNEHSPVPILTASATKLGTDVIEMGNYLGEYAVNPTIGTLNDIEKYENASTKDVTTMTSLIEAYAKS
jgi:hypothetical protein